MDLDSEVKDWSTCSVFELRDECSKRNLDSKGKKTDLIGRLQAHVENAQNVREDETGTSPEEAMQTDTVQKHEDKEEEPIMLLKGKFSFYYNFNHALKMVIVNPFLNEFMKVPDVMKWCQQAKSFDIEKLQDGHSEAVFYFDSLTVGDTCFLELREALRTYQTKVFHPAITSKEENHYIILNCGSYWSRLDSYSEIAVSPCEEEEANREEIYERLVVLENVPDGVTEEHLLNKFPGSISVIVFPYSPNTIGLMMVEFPKDAKILRKFNKIRTIKMSGQDVTAEKYSTRVMRWEQEKPQIIRKDTNSKFEDNERVNICKKIKEMESMKNMIINSEDKCGVEKLKHFCEMHEKIRELTNQIQSDTGRRLYAGLKIPEPKEFQSFQTKSALRNKPGVTDRKRPFGDDGQQSLNKRVNTEVGFGRGGGGRNFGGGGTNFGGRGGFSQNQGEARTFGGNQSFGNNMNRGRGGFNNMNNRGGGFNNNRGGGFGMSAGPMGYGSGFGQGW